MTRKKENPQLTPAQRSIRQGIRILFDACRQEPKFCEKLLVLIESDPEWRDGAAAEGIAVEDGKLIEKTKRGCANG